MEPILTLVFREGGDRVNTSAIQFTIKDSELRTIHIGSPADQSDARSSASLHPSSPDDASQRQT